MFDYYDESNIRGIKVVIGEFLSHQVKWKKDNGELLSIEEVNNLDRMKIAEDFIKHRTQNGKYKIDAYYTVLREYEQYELENDIAQFIDLKIPKHYWIRLQEKKVGYYRDRTILSRKYKGINSVEGLDFSYDENYQLEFHF